MSQYRDNDKNTVGNINENYGRELPELHTVDVNAGNDDVIAVGRVFTTPEGDYSQLSADPDTVENTGLTLKDYLSSRLQQYPLEKCGAGEMIVI